jgi:ribosomal protein L20A (L18A)
MKKLDILKKQLIKKIVKYSIILAIFGGGFFTINHFLQTKINELAKIDQQINQNQSEISQIENKTNIYETLFNEYNKINAQLENNAYNLDIERGSKVLELLGKKHRISNFSVEITPIKNITPANVSYTGYTPVSRNVTLSFFSMSDAHIYAFLDNLNKYFTGYLQFNNISIKSSRVLDYSILDETFNGKNPPLIDAKIQFIWLGIEKVIQPDPNNPNQPLNNS